MMSSKHAELRGTIAPNHPTNLYPEAVAHAPAVLARARGTHRLWRMLLLLTLVLMLAACGGDGDDNDDDSDDGDGAESGAPALLAATSDVAGVEVGAAIASLALPGDLGPEPIMPAFSADAVNGAEAAGASSAGAGGFASAVNKGVEIFEKFEKIPASVDEYLDAYNAAYQLAPRQGTSPLEIAETYMRRYQPGPLPRVFQHSIMTDRNGNVLAELVNEGRRTWVPIDQISPHVIDAIVATEDASFFENQGIDPRRVVAALMQNASSGGVVSGASTITMQLARNMFFSPERRYDQSMERKVFEMLIAQDLTMLYTKDEILEMYLNLIYFGHRAYGVEAASQVYFGKSAADLTLAEATIIAGIPQQPADLDPMLNFDAARERQRIVLDLMARRGIITPSEADAVFAEPIVVLEEQPILPAKAPHFVQWVQVRVANELGVDSVGRAGLRITTTLDLPMQELAQSVVRTQVDNLRGAYNMNSAALVALRPPDGQVLAMVGSADYDNVQIDGNVNATISPRQPGSSIKSILYAAAFNDNVASPASVLWDLPVAFQINELTTYRPQNYDEKFHGPVTARAALANSYNIPAVKLLDQVGPDRMATVGYAMGLKTLSTQKGAYGLPLTLGANEVTLLDLTTAYHTIQNNGQYAPYQAVLSATDALGRPVNLEPQQAPTPVLSPAAAYQVTSVLSDRDARAPMFGVNSILNLTRPAAAKTGTTNSYRDNLTMGYTRYLVAGVWAGNPDGQPMRGATGITGAAPIWHDFMEAVIADPAMLARLGAPEDPAAWDFVPPEDVVRRQTVCPENLTCPESGENFTRDWLAVRGTEG
ncbi:MAG: transglycosylase domain-containing protein, partial [Caldilineaceae bacterium]